ASEVPPVRTRSWKKVLPPEEHERRQYEDEHDTTDFVVEPEAADERPVIRDLYVEDDRLIGPRGTLSARTGSAWLRRQQGSEDPPARHEQPGQNRAGPVREITAADLLQLIQPLRPGG